MSTQPVALPRIRPSREKARALAATKLRKLSARRRRIRRYVIAAAMSAFALCWGVMYTALVAGHDPALSRLASAGGGVSGSAAAASAASAPVVTSNSDPSQTPVQAAPVQTSHS